MPGGEFNMRGRAYRRVQEHADQRVPGGRATLLAALPDAMRSFFATSFESSAWYPYLPLDPITRVAAEIIGEPQSIYLRTLGEYFLQRDASALYAAMHEVSPKEVASALPKVAHGYFDFTRLTVHDLTERSCLVRNTGVPLEAAMTYIIPANVFIIRALEGAGARHVVCEASAPQSAGEAHGRATANFERRFSWALL